MTRPTCLQGVKGCDIFCELCSAFKWNYVSSFSCFWSLNSTKFPNPGTKRPNNDPALYKSLSNSNFTPILVLWGYHDDLTKSPWCKMPEGDCSAFNYAPTFNELFVRDLWDGTSLRTNWLPDGDVLKWKSYVSAFKKHGNSRERWQKSDRRVGEGTGNKHRHRRYQCRITWEERMLQGVLRPYQQTERWKHYLLRGPGTPVRQDSPHTGFM